MNIYTVAKASQGLADYLKKNFTEPSVAIGYDSRIKSDVFAKVAAGVFSANQRLESGERNILTSSFGLACRVIEALDMDASKFYHGDYYLEELKTIEGKRFGDRGKHQFK